MPASAGVLSIQDARRKCMDTVLLYFLLSGELAAWRQDLTECCSQARLWSIGGRTTTAILNRF